jgi:hypothetical protein
MFSAASPKIVHAAFSLITRKRCNGWRRLYKMAYYLVRAKPKANLAELRAKLDAGEIALLEPFGREMQQCLSKARLDAEGFAVWEELCYCSPPLKQEREVLDLYFSDLSTQSLNKGEAWTKIAPLPLLWG